MFRAINEYLAKINVVTDQSMYEAMSSFLEKTKLVDNFSINVRLSDEEIAKRKEMWKYQGKKVESKWLRQYQKLVTNASNGAILEA